MQCPSDNLQSIHHQANFLQASIQLNQRRAFWFYRWQLVDSFDQHFTWIQSLQWRETSESRNVQGILDFRIDSTNQCLQFGEKFLTKIIKTLKKLNWNKKLFENLLPSWLFSFKLLSIDKELNESKEDDKMEELLLFYKWKFSITKIYQSFLKNFMNQHLWSKILPQFWKSYKFKVKLRGNLAWTAVLRSSVLKN